MSIPAGPAVFPERPTEQPRGLDGLDSVALALLADPAFLAAVAALVAPQVGALEYEAHSFVVADAADSPTARVVQEDRLVGRVTGGVVSGLDSAQVRDLLDITEDATASTASLRTLGTGVAQALPGNHSSTTNARTPTGAAGGRLSGNYPNPGLAAVSGAVYTQTYATADRTLGAYTSNPESTAYVAGAPTEIAKVGDLNALRVAYETLRIFVEDLAGVVNAHTDDLQAAGLFG